MLIPGFESGTPRRRVSVCKETPPPAGDKTWTEWVPEIVIEVVSKSSAKRDYEEKPDEYLEFGVTEYWIVDCFQTRDARSTPFQRQKMDRAEGARTKDYKTTLLPGQEFSCEKVFAAAEAFPE